MPAVQMVLPLVVTLGLPIQDLLVFVTLAIISTAPMFAPAVQRMQRVLVKIQQHLRVQRVIQNQQAVVPIQVKCQVVRLARLNRVVLTVAKDKGRKSHEKFIINLVFTHRIFISSSRQDAF